MNLIDSLLEKAKPAQEQRIHARMVLAAHLADALKAKGWTSADLATRLHKQPAEIDSWLSGTHDFTEANLTDLNSVLKTDLANSITV